MVAPTPGTAASRMLPFAGFGMGFGVGAGCGAGIGFGVGGNGMF